MSLKYTSLIYTRKIRILIALILYYDFIQVSRGIGTLQHRKV